MRISEVSEEIMPGVSACILARKWSASLMAETVCRSSSEQSSMYIRISFAVCTAMSAVSGSMSYVMMNCANRCAISQPLMRLGMASRAASMPLCICSLCVIMSSLA